MGGGDACWLQRGLRSVDRAGMGHAWPAAVSLLWGLPDLVSSRHSLPLVEPAVGGPWAFQGQSLRGDSL